MTASMALSYEFFLRDAFGIHHKGDDPAGLASADIYNSTDTDDLRKAKIGLQYAILAMERKFSNEKQLVDPEDYNKIRRLLDEADDITCHQKLNAVIKQACELREYFISLPDII